MMRLMRLIPGLRKSRICCGSHVKRVPKNTVTLNEVQGEVPSAERKDTTSTAVRIDVVKDTMSAGEAREDA